MEAVTGPSLEISFGDDAVTVRLHVREDRASDLRRLALRFQSGVHRTSTILDIEIDDLLSNLRALKAWPEPETVHWEPQLAQLVRDSAADAQTVAQRLTSPAPTTPEAVPEDLEGILGPAWTGDLTSFQRRDIVKLLSLRHGANFSVPGAGKTRVGLAVFQALRQRGEIEQLLVVSPKAAYESWLHENQVCFRLPLRISVHGKGFTPSPDALIINYERLDSALEELGRWLSSRPTLLLLDEAHRMKAGSRGVYGSACLALGPRARRRLILTGTPAPNGAKDLENLLGFVWPGFGRQRVIQAVGGGDLSKASQVLRPLFTRTTKQELGLPPVETKITPLEMPPLHNEIYEALVGRFSARATGSEADFLAWGKITVYLLMAATSPALLRVGSTRYEPLEYRVPPLQVPRGTQLFELLQDLPSYEFSPKYREALAIVNANAAQGRKTLVWSTFIRSLNTLGRILKEFQPALVHGGTKDRDLEIERFRDDPDCMVLLSNPATLGEGISLHQHCNDAVYIDRDFAAGRFLQSLDRIHRLGLDPNVTTRITVLTSEQTIDDIVKMRLEQKLQFMGKVLDDPEVRQLSDLDEEPAVGGGLDEIDLQALMGHVLARAS